MGEEFSCAKRKEYEEEIRRNIMARDWNLLKGRHFLKLLDYTPEEIEYLVDLAADLKEKRKTESVWII